MDQQNQLEIPMPSINSVGQSIQEEYAPSSVEKKKALIMYFLFGIMIAISDKKINDFELFHLKQAMGWWMVFMLSVMVSVLILFIPIIKIVGIVLLFSLMAILVVFVKQARDGKSYIVDKQYGLAIFPSLGAWLLSLFDISFDKNLPKQNDVQGLVPPQTPTVS